MRNITCLTALVCAVRGSKFASAFVVPHLTPPRYSYVKYEAAFGRQEELRMSTSVDQPEDLLSEYESQEKMIVERGALEEGIMAASGVPILANKIKERGVGGGGGFGGGGPSKVTKKAEGKSHSKVLKRDGVVRINGVLSDKVADGLRDYVYELKADSEQAVADGSIKPIQRFATVLLRKDRCDLTIPLGSPIVTKALEEVFCKSSVGETIRALLGKGAVLQELSTLISDPGSQRQVVHPDTPCMAGEGPVLYTCFIALQDITLDMGATVWLPGTHTPDSHKKFRDSESPVGGGESTKDKLLRTQPSALGTLTKGSCAIFDSRCLHCGGANRSADSRALFYFSFKNSKIGYAGNPPSIRKELINQLTLQDLESDLTLFSMGKGSPQLDMLAASHK